MFPGRSDIHASETETHEGLHHELEVMAGGRHSVELVTPERSGEWSLSLRVAVVDENGAPVPGAEILLSNMEGKVGDGVSDGKGLCLFPRLHDGVQRLELHVSAYADGFCIGGEGANISAWPEGKPAEALVTLHRPVKILLRVTEEGTGSYIPGVRLYVADRWRMGPEDYSEWKHEGGMGVDVMPGKVRLAASAPGYSMAGSDVEVRRGEPTQRFEFRLKRLQP
jgi:hypothetical protein